MGVGKIKLTCKATRLKIRHPPNFLRIPKILYICVLDVICLIFQAFQMIVWFSFHFQLMVAAVKAYFNLDCSIKQVLQLDASTTNKYSCHLVFTQGTLIFQNNVQAGTTVKIQVVAFLCVSSNPHYHGQ